ncbi:MAG: hypothetical protein AAF945_20855 [Actinomycetota bacterium]
MGTHRTPALVVATVIVAACGSSSSSDEGALPTIGTEPPADTVSSIADAPPTDSSVPSATSEPIWPSDIDVSEITEVSIPPPHPSAAGRSPCPPEAPPSPPADPSVTTTPFQEQARLEPTLGLVLQYGTEHPDDFGGYGFHWRSDADGVVFASFTGDLDAHEAALRDIVDDPDDVVVCPAAANQATQRVILAILLDELSDRFASVGVSPIDGTVRVELLAGDEELADDLIDRFGRAVDLQVGMAEYPSGEAAIECPPRLVPSLLPGLEVSLVGEPSAIGAEVPAHVEVVVRLTNTSEEIITFDSGIPATAITDSTGVPRTVDQLGTAALGATIELEPGSFEEFPRSVSLAACDPTDGTVIPEGDHFVVVSFFHAGLREHLHSEPLPITVGS